MVPSSRAPTCRCILSGADLSGAKLGGATLSTDLAQAIFNSPPVFSNDQTNPTSFKNATLKYTLLGQNWSYFDLTGAKFVDSPEGLALTGLQAIHVKAPGINLSGAKLIGAALSNADFSGAILTGADFSKATLTKTDFTGSTLLGTKFINCDLTQATFSPNPAFGTPNCRPLSPGRRTSMLPDRSELVLPRPDRRQDRGAAGGPHGARGPDRASGDPDEDSEDEPLRGQACQRRFQQRRPQRRQPRRADLTGDS